MICDDLNTVDYLALILMVDPWGPTDEIGDSECHFCHSGEHRYEDDHAFVGRHFHDCLWVKARLATMDGLLPGHEVYTPPPPSVCKTCGYTYTYDEHANIFGSGDEVKHKQCLKNAADAYRTRPLRELFPILSASRGRVTFLNPIIDLSKIREPGND